MIETHDVEMTNAEEITNNDNVDVQRESSTDDENELDAEDFMVVDEMNTDESMYAMLMNKNSISKFSANRLSSFQLSTDDAVGNKKPVTMKDIACLLILFKYRHRLSIQCISDLLKLLLLFGVDQAPHSWYQLKNGDVYQQIKTVCTDPFLTLTMNVDGVEVRKGLKRSIWPILFVVNELPLKQRYALENVIIAGIWSGLKKPSRLQMKSIITPIVEELSLLEQGYAFTDHTKESLNQENVIKGIDFTPIIVNVFFTWETVSSVPLIIHPEGLGRRKPKVKIKLNND
ncbi:unnamed protein product [Rotaria sordida]|uniref:Uncharacterized protein n=2 Tax=Rotaria sordida TaxID=392033 RepID=A0A819XJ16_9BILA|nr:unnamed protein product [Rotaria sordida]